MLSSAITMRPGMHASKQLAHRIIQNLTFLLNQPLLTETFTDLLADALAYRDILAGSSGISVLVGVVEWVKLLQHTEKWLGSQLEDNPLFLSVPDLIIFLLQQIELQTLGSDM